MCTAVSYLAGDHYFGRNLDLEYSYHETVTITPRNYPFYFRHSKPNLHHHAMIGMAFVQEGYPLYYEATNEQGLSMAGLNFPRNAHYHTSVNGLTAVAPFEVIPWVLSQCESVSQARELLSQTLVVQEHFSDQLPASPLHWIIADAKESIVLESVKEGMKVYDNPVGVLANNPPFDYHLTHLTEFMGVTSRVPENRFAPSLNLQPYSLGMGSMGLPGDLSSASRFVRAAFVKLNSHPAQTDAQNISQFFHMLDFVAQPKGCTLVRPGEYEFTLYSSCCNTTKGVYYYKTYDNNQITAVDMHAENLDSEHVISYPLMTEQRILLQNA